MQEIDALILANPFVVAPVFTELGICNEVSQAGAEALRRIGVPAQAVRCWVDVHDKVRDLRVAVGASPEQLYAQLDWNGEAPRVFDEWKAEQVELGDASVPPLHAAIVVKAPTKNLLVDLTFGQVRRLGLDVSWSAVFPFERAPFAYTSTNGLTVRYEIAAEPLPRTIPSEDFIEGMAATYERLARLALRLNLNSTEFNRALATVNPEAYDLTQRVLREFQNGVF